MKDDRIIDIFQEHGQYVTGKDYAMIRAIAEAVSPQRTWVGLTHEEHMEIKTGTMTTSSRMAAVEAKLKEKNT